MFFTNDSKIRSLDWAKSWTLRLQRTIIGAKGCDYGQRHNNRRLEDLPAPVQYEARSALVEGP